jgi:peptidoglycan/LPS O-acetylase OafA/YrhL
MIKSLEGGRGLAALIVALYHLKIGAQQWALIRHGYLFVDLFFVLSGFVICAAYSARMETGQDFRSFFIRRFGRLWPLLVFSTLAFILLQNGIVAAKQVAVASGHTALLGSPDALRFMPPDPWQLLAVATFTHALGLFDDLILNTPTWSISTEFVTYMLFALICLSLRERARILTYAVLAAASLAICVWASINVHQCLLEGGCLSLTWDFGLPRSTFSFFLGALCWHWSRKQRIHSNAWGLAGLLMLALLLPLLDQHPALAFGFPFVFAVLILACCQDQGWLATALKTRPLQVLGERSYSIYLMHMPLLLFFENLVRRTDSVGARLAILLAFVAVLVLISGWTYRYVEHPFRDLFNRLAKPRPAMVREPKLANDQLS